MKKFDCLIRHLDSFLVKGAQYHGAEVVKLLKCTRREGKFSPLTLHKTEINFRSKTTDVDVGFVVFSIRNVRVYVCV